MRTSWGIGMAFIKGTSCIEAILANLIPSPPGVTMDRVRKAPAVALGILLVPMALCLHLGGMVFCFRSFETGISTTPSLLSLIVAVLKGPNGDQGPVMLGIAQTKERNNLSSS